MSPPAQSTSGGPIPLTMLAMAVRLAIALFRRWSPHHAPMSHRPVAGDLIRWPRATSQGPFGGVPARGRLDTGELFG